MNGVATLVRKPLADAAVLALLSLLLWVMPVLVSEGQVGRVTPLHVDRAVMPADVAALPEADALALALAAVPHDGAAAVPHDEGRGR